MDERSCISNGHWVSLLSLLVVCHATPFSRHVAGELVSTFKYISTKVSILKLPLKHKEPTPRLTWDDICWIQTATFWPLFVAGVPPHTKGKPEQPRAPLRLIASSSTCLAGSQGIPNLFTSVYSLHNHARFPYYLKLLFIIADFTFFSPTDINIAVNERVSSRKCLCTRLCHTQQQYDLKFRVSSPVWRVCNEMIVKTRSNLVKFLDLLTQVAVSSRR